MRALAVLFSLVIGVPALGQVTLDRPAPDVHADMIRELLESQTLVAQEEQPECEGPYKGKRLTHEELLFVLERHKEWISSGGAYMKNYSDPRRANLCSSGLEGVDLVKAELQGADLSGAHIPYANLTGTVLAYANLSWTFLHHTKLSEANLIEAQLSRAFLVNSDLAGADLKGANLSGAYLEKANLSGAHLVGANLSGADLVGANLSGASLIDANLFGITFLWRDASQFGVRHALVELRNTYADVGVREKEREITYVLHHQKTKSQLADWEPEGVFNYVLFELTTKWAMEPERAVVGLIALIPVFVLPYGLALWAPRKDGIWRFWSNERARTDLGGDKPELLKVRGLSTIGYAFYFSLLSAFHIGWRDLNVGNWIARIQPREYTLRASGWVRTVSGIQSLISVYLLAIWALTYFGRPFE